MQKQVTSKNTTSSTLLRGKIIAGCVCVRERVQPPVDDSTGSCMGIFSESVGSTYGQLTIVRLLEPVQMSRGKHYRVEAQCICGTVKDVWFADLRRGHVTTCGCRTGRSIEYGSGKRYQDTSKAAFNGLYNHVYKRGALSRGFVFDLSAEQFAYLTKLACHYCGAMPASEAKTATSLYIYNGIDRVDNALGYLPTNVAPCCTSCNIAKRAMGHEEFLDWARRIVEHLRPELTSYQRNMP